MLKAWYGPSTEDLWESISTMMILADIEEDIATAVIDALKAKGYEIAVEVEIHGPMEDALRSLPDAHETYATRMRPVRQLRT